MKKTLVLDLDGVIATGTTEEVYSDEAGWAFEKCEVMEGAKEGLERLSKEYNLILSTARRKTDIDKTMKWLKEKGLIDFFTEIRIDEKPSAELYIDDKAYRFTTWDKLNKDFWGGKNLRLVRAKKDDYKNEELMKRLYDIVCDERNAQLADTIVSSYEETVNVWYKTIFPWDNDYAWFLFDGDILVGWLECWGVRDNTGWLLIMLHRDYQGKGIGGKAIEMFEKECFEVIGLRKLFLGVDSFNPNARRLYERLGWKLEGVISEAREVNGKLWDRIIMSKKPSQ